MVKALGAAAIALACLLAACSRMREKRAQIARLLSLRDSLLFLRRELSERRTGSAPSSAATVSSCATAMRHTAWFSATT